MPGKITKYFRIHSAKQFYEQFSEAEPSNLYFFIARPNKWDDELLPPDPIDSTEQTVYNVWENMMALKKISSADVSFGVDRVEWVAGKVYTQYTGNTEFFEDNDFYVITEDYNVYKCIYNNQGATSTTKPYGTGTTNVTLADGYIWKYMFTVNASDALKFTTTRMFPVKTLTTDDGSYQWAVQEAAVVGSVDTISVSAGGVNYKEHVGSLASGGTTTATLSSSADDVNDVYNGSTIYITSGTGAGQLRTITDYNGSTKLITVSESFSPAVDGSSAYVVSPKVNIFGDGQDVKAYSRVVGSSISSINVINIGSGYTYVSGTISAAVGSGAVITPQLSPVGGHGSNAVDELFAHNVIMNVRMTGSVSNTFIVANDFRVVGILADPIESSSNTVADNTAYNQTMRITISDPFNSFSDDEIITGGTSGANAFMIEYHSNTVLSVTGGNRINFIEGETITGSVSAATGKVESIEMPDLIKYSGKLLYVENRSPVSRSADQSEDVKILLRF